MSFISLRNRYCIPDSPFIIVVTPETVSRVTLAMLGIGFQPNFIGLSVVVCWLLFVGLIVQTYPQPTTHDPQPVIPGGNKKKYIIQAYATTCIMYFFLSSKIKGRRRYDLYC